MSKEWIGGGLAGGTLNSFETDEEGNVYFNPQGFLKGFVYGAAGTKAVKLALQKSPALRKKAENFLSKSGEFLDDALKNPLMLPQEKARFAVVANKAMNNALDNRKFIIGGENAIGANRDKLARARVMQKQGKDEGEIWDKTGWYLDKDGKWKFEINAAGGKIKESVNIPFTTLYKYEKYFKEIPLKDLLDDKALFRAYPQLKDITIQLYKDNPFYQSGRAGGYFEGMNIIDLNLSHLLTENDLKSTLYHEIQHAVQHFENFARGGDLGTFAKLPQEQKNKIAAELGTDDMDNIFHTAYKRLHGETEARNVEQRMKLQDFANNKGVKKDPLASKFWKEKTKLHPHKTQDVDIKDTIIDFGNENTAKMSSEKLDKGENLAKNEVLELNTDGKKAFFKDLRSRVLNAWKKNRQAEFKNENNGIVAQISNDGIGKMMSPKAVDKSIKNKFSKEAHFLGVENAGKLFEKSKFSHSEAPRNQTDDIVAYHKYNAKAVFDGKPSNVKLTLKESIQAGHKIYSLELLEIE